MNLTRSQLLIRERLERQFSIESVVVNRRGRDVRELSPVIITLDRNDLSVFDEYRQHEYDQYRMMIQSQIIRFDNDLNRDKFGRRLLIQFPADWYADKPEDYMPCPESFFIQYYSENTYTVIANFRSTEMSRAYEDIAIIKALCEKELVLPGEMVTMFVHFMNIHIYEDQGSSEDFDVTVGYFNKK